MDKFILEFYDYILENKFKQYSHNVEKIMREKFIKHNEIKESYEKQIKEMQNLMQDGTFDYFNK